MGGVSLILSGQPRGLLAPTMHLHIAPHPAVPLFTQYKWLSLSVPYLKWKVREDRVFVFLL